MIAAVKSGGDGAVIRRVLRDVGVHQIERDPTDLDPPDPAGHFAARHRHRHRQRRPVRLVLADERQVVEVVLGIPLLLPAVDVEVLAEVPLAVHETDADERQAKVGRGLQMIAGQEPEAAGIDRHALVDAELGGEVRHPVALDELLVRRGVPAVGLLEPRLLPHVLVHRVGDAIEMGEEAVVLEELVEPFLADGRDELDGAVVELVEKGVVDAAEEGDGLMVPAPAHVVGDALQSLQSSRQMGQDGEGSERTGSHAAPLAGERETWPKTMSGRTWGSGSRRIHYR